MFRSISSQDCLFRSVTFFVQAELLLCKNTIAVRPLCSTGITLRQRSYGPLRLPPPQINALLIPRHPCSLLTSNSLLRGGYPRYSDYSVDVRSLQSPRPIQCLHKFVTSALIIGFTTSGRLAIGICVTRPKRVHFIRAHIFVVETYHRLSHRPGGRYRYVSRALLPQHAEARLTDKQTIVSPTSFHVGRIIQHSWRNQRTQRKEHRETQHGAAA